METKLFIAYNGNKPIRDFFKDTFEIIEAKTENGTDYIILRDRDVNKTIDMASTGSPNN